MDERQWTAHRCCILSSGISVGIFRQEAKSKLLVIALSAGASYSFIKDFSHQSSSQRHGVQDYIQSDFIHLTKFVPAKYFAPVKYVLMFRNSHSIIPYLCERYHLPESQSKIHRAECDNAKKVGTSEIQRCGAFSPSVSRFQVTTLLEYEGDIQSEYKPLTDAGIKGRPKSAFASIPSNQSPHSSSLSSTTAIYTTTKSQYNHLFDEFRENPLLYEATSLLPPSAKLSSAFHGRSKASSLTTLSEEATIKVQGLVSANQKSENMNEVNAQFESLSPELHNLLDLDIYQVGAFIIEVDRKYITPEGKFNSLADDSNYNGRSERTIRQPQNERADTAPHRRKILELYVDSRPPSSSATSEDEGGGGSGSAEIAHEIHGITRLESRQACEGLTFEDIRSSPCDYITFSGSVFQVHKKIPRSQSEDIHASQVIAPRSIHIDSISAFSQCQFYSDVHKSGMKRGDHCDTDSDDINDPENGCDDKLISKFHSVFIKIMSLYTTTTSRVRFTGRAAAIDKRDKIPNKTLVFVRNTIDFVKYSADIEIGDDEGGESGGDNQKMDNSFDASPLGSCSPHTRTEDSNNRQNNSRDDISQSSSSSFEIVKLRGIFPDGVIITLENASKTMSILGADGSLFQITLSQAIEIVFEGCGAGHFSDVQGGLTVEGTRAISPDLIAKFRHVLSSFHMIQQEYGKTRGGVDNNSSSNGLIFPGMALLSTAELMNIERFSKLRAIEKVHNFSGL